GVFERAAEALPDVFANGACVAPADIDGDGDVDLFVGSRVVARRYGEIPPSVLLIHDGAGHFTDETAARAPGLACARLVTAAAWADTNGDGRLDLIVVGAWMSVRVFVQEAGQWLDRTDRAGLMETAGWWNAVEAADLDGDGDADLILGNLGLNALIQARPGE